MINRILLGSPTRVLTARCPWQFPLDALQVFHSSPLLLQEPTFPTPMSRPMEKPEKKKEAAQ